MGGKTLWQGQTFNSSIANVRTSGNPEFQKSETRQMSEMSDKVDEILEKRLTVGRRYGNVNDVLRIAPLGSSLDTLPPEGLHDPNP